jgi:hypothetical protein
VNKTKLADFNFPAAVQTLRAGHAIFKFRAASGRRLLQHRFGRARDGPIKFSQTLLISSFGNKKAHAWRGLEITAVLPTSDFSVSRFDDLLEVIFTRLDVDEFRRHQYHAQLPRSDGDKFQPQILPGGCAVTRIKSALAAENRWYNLVP